MQYPYDVLIVGSGLFGSTCAYELNKLGFRCLVVEKRDHIGGNCFTEQRDGINVHKYGAHIFHTSNESIWNWINQFATFNHYRHRVKVNHGGKIFSFPINLSTLYQLWGVTTSLEAEKHLAAVRIPHNGNDNLESWILSQVGAEIYNIFFKSYTRKQWDRSPSELPSSIVRRVPIRLMYNDDYFDDPYQGIPIGGYSQIFSQLLANIKVLLNTNYLENRTHFDSQASRILYTGPLDAFFDFRFGKLEYRSLRFEHTRLDSPDFQSIAVMNYTAAEIPFTRVIEHKHFEFGKQPVTWITREYPAGPSADREPIYPINTNQSQQIVGEYKQLSKHPRYSRYYFGGRLAEYRYYDMHQVIGSALNRVKEIAQRLTK
jgi:UDP-galactopyranose mutase